LGNKIDSHIEDKQYRQRVFMRVFNKITIAQHIRPIAVSVALSDAYVE
jgi:hypothetical protein